MSNFREQQREKRVVRTARRIAAAGGLSRMKFPDLDAVAAPGAGGAWVVPEPSPETLAHFNAHGIAMSDDDARGAGKKPADGMPPAPALRAPVVVAESSPGFAAAVQAAVAATLARLGIKAPEPVPDTGAPPVNEDR